ncbi:MAG TPA: prepilin peptidase [Nocardioides sp.]|nr:prepilin peptidase [Nocardioides sp.]
MEWHLIPAAACAAIGAASGLLVPRIIGSTPEPEPDPEEKPGEYPDKIPYAELAARPRLTVGSVVAGGLAGAALGVVLGWSWALPWLLVLLPVGTALAVIDYVTWYLPSRIIRPAYAVVGVLVLVASAARPDWRYAAASALGFVLIGGYYGILRFISPRMMAGGDVRLGALLGLALGPFGVMTLLLSVLLAAVSMLVALPAMRLLGNTVKREEGVLGGLGRRHLPFGPFLIVGALLAVLLGQVLVLG